MITINLLPHREAARKKRREQFFVHLGLAAVAGLAVSAAIFGVYEARMAEQQQRNGFLQSEIAKLDVQIKEIATLQQELDGLKARQAAVESLQADRNLPVYLLNEMVKQLPEGVYLRTLKQEDMAIAIEGVAQSQERVSELLRNLGNHSPWLTKPQLIEITATTASLGQRGQRRVFNFSLRATLTKEAATAAGQNGAAASTPAAGKV
ncbi:PilN domain-containing protein [Aquabacterium sp. A08]|uniref:PilN domain-containing protein n=1 Tax=Aquabacterium sp. A08 TaxID=2718532 RepID=UPI00141E9F3F|nr:PilN domain-containing protein [Aquabacterium sp. A08]NIC42461.1 PilN domain-containing protein [Aquabacterium sp. A08]NIC42500.1 PilN domain-containing protein [Aquabacterium sp. A08]